MEKVFVFHSRIAIYYIIVTKNLQKFQKLSGLVSGIDGYVPRDGYLISDRIYNNSWFILQE